MMSSQRTGMGCCSCFSTSPDSHNNRFSESQDWRQGLVGWCTWVELWQCRPDCSSPVKRSGTRSDNDNASLPGARPPGCRSEQPAPATTIPFPVDVGRKGFVGGEPNSFFFFFLRWTLSATIYSSCCCRDKSFLLRRVMTTMKVVCSLVFGDKLLILLRGHVADSVFEASSSAVAKIW